MKIVVSGGWSYGNIGDEAIARSTMYMIDKYIPYSEVVYLSYNPDDFLFHHNTPSAPSLHKLLEKYKDSKDEITEVVKKREDKSIASYIELFDEDTLFIMAGGGYFMAPDNFLFRVHILELQIAQERGAKTAIIGQSIGPIIGQEYIDAFQRVVRLCDYINVRDKDSYDFVKSIIPDKEIKLGADTALVIDEIFPFHKKSKDEKVINITPIGYANYASINGVRIKKINFRYYSRISLEYYFYYYRFRKIVKTIAKENCKINFVLSTTWGFHEKFANKIIKSIPNANVQIHKNINIEEMCRILAEGDYIISAKLHPIIISSAYGIESVAISYNYKVDEFMRIINRQEYCYKNYMLSAREVLKQYKASEGRLTGKYLDSVEQMKGKVHAMFQDLAKW